MNEHYDKKGRFYLPMEILRTLPFEQIEKLFSGIIVCEVEMNYLTNTARYWALSTLFEPVPVGNIIPYYTATWNTEEETWAWKQLPLDSKETLHVIHLP